jgi:hypothetical protein
VHKPGTTPALLFSAENLLRDVWPELNEHGADGALELRLIPSSFAGADWKQNAVMGTARMAVPRSKVRREEEKIPGIDTA